MKNLISLILLFSFSFAKLNTNISIGAIVGGEKGAKTGFSIATSGEINNRQLHKDEVKWLKNSIKDFKSKNKDKTVWGKEIEYSDEKALRLLETSAKYLVDKESKENFDDNDKYIGVNEFSKEEIENTAKYIKENSQDKYFINTYKEDMNKQKFFTATKEQNEDSNYTPDTTIGLIDNSEVLLPSTQVGKTIFNTSKTISPVIIKKSEQVYDDVTFGFIKEANKITPDLTNKYLKNPVKITEGSLDFIESYLPGIPVNNKWGRRGFVTGTIFDNKDNITELIKDIYNKEGE